MEEKLFPFELTETELDILNDILRKHKVSLSLEEMAMVQINKQQQVPILALLYKVAGVWEQKQAQKQATPPAQDAAVETTEN